MINSKVSFIVVVAVIVIFILATIFYQMNLTECTWKECNDDKSECSEHKAWLLNNEIEQFKVNDGFVCK